MNTVDGVPASVPLAYLSKTSQSFHVSVRLPVFLCLRSFSGHRGNLACVSGPEVQAQEQPQLMRKRNLWARTPVSSVMEQLWVVLQKFYQTIPSGNGLRFPRRALCSNEAFINLSFPLSNCLSHIFLLMPVIALSSRSVLYFLFCGNGDGSCSISPSPTNMVLSCCSGECWKTLYREKGFFFSWCQLVPLGKLQQHIKLPQPLAVNFPWTASPVTSLR